MQQVDILEMQKLISLEATNKNDWDSIFNLYKKYVDENLQDYQVGCGCGNSIERLFEDLKSRYLRGVI